MEVTVLNRIELYNHEEEEIVQDYHLHVRNGKGDFMLTAYVPYLPLDCVSVYIGKHGIKMLEKYCDDIFEAIRSVEKAIYDYNESRR